MITASHNPKQDNGVKIIERDGSMLVPEWESVAEEFANSKDIAQTLLDLNDGKLGINLGFDLFDIIFSSDKHICDVFLGHDTRETSYNLIVACGQGVDLTGSNPKNFGLVTTPQLHFLVQSNGELGDGEVDPDEVDKDLYSDFFA